MAMLAAASGLRLFFLIGLGLQQAVAVAVEAGLIPLSPFDLGGAETIAAWAVDPDDRARLSLNGRRRGTILCD